MCGGKPINIAPNKYVLSPLQSCRRQIFTPSPNKKTLSFLWHLVHFRVSVARAADRELHSQGKQMAFKHGLITALPSLRFPVVVHFLLPSMELFLLVYFLSGHQPHMAGGQHCFLAYLRAILGSNLHLL